MTVSPLLLLDVDGVLSPTFAKTRPQGYSAYQACWSELGVINPQPRRIWLNENHGPWLQSLGAEMRWATAWEDMANWQIGPRIGLDSLDYIEWTNRSFTRNPDGSHWKLDDIMLNADGRPFVWIDDGVSGADTVRVALEYPAPALLYRVDPRWGLTDDDVMSIWQWLDRVS